MKAYIRYTIVWLINTALILGANSLFPQNYVLGNAVIPPVYAALFTGFLLTVLCRAAKPVATKLKAQEKGRYVMFLIYFGVNTISIWVLARVSFLTGFGISAFYFAIFLGLATDLGQWVARQIFKATKLLD